jgi:hypothetical protein
MIYDCFNQIIWYFRWGDADAIDGIHHPQFLNKFMDGQSVNGIKHAINHQHMAGLWLRFIDIKGQWVADDLNGSENFHFDIAGEAMSSLAPQDFSLFWGGELQDSIRKTMVRFCRRFYGKFCRRFYGRQWDILLHSYGYLIYVGNDKSMIMAMLNSWRLPVFYTGFSMWRPWENPQATGQEARICQKGHTTTSWARIPVVPVVGFETFLWDVSTFWGDKQVKPSCSADVAVCHQEYISEGPTGGRTPW